MGALGKRAYRRGSAEPAVYFLFRVDSSLSMGALGKRAYRRGSVEPVPRHNGGG